MAPLAILTLPASRFWPGPYSRPVTFARQNPEPPEPAVAEVAIRGDMIRLGQLLKLAGVVGDGGEAKALLAGGEVLVNDEPESRRGRQLHPGDVIRAGEAAIRVAAHPDSPFR